MPSTVTRVSLGFGDWLLASCRPGSAAMPDLRQAAAAFLSTRPRCRPGRWPEFCPVPDASLPAILGPAVMHCRQAGSATVYYAAEQCDQALARMIATAATAAPFRSFRIELVAQAEMSARQQLPLIVVLEPAGVTAYCRVDLITPQLAGALQGLLASWRTEAPAAGAPARARRPLRAAGLPG